MKRGFAQVVKRRMQPCNEEAALLRSSQDQVSEPASPSETEKHSIVCFVTVS